MRIKAQRWHGCNLLAEAERLNQSTVALNVAVLYVVKQRAALTYHLNEGSFCRMILTVGLHMFRQMGNTVGNKATWLSTEPVSELDFPYLPKISCFLAESKYIVILNK